MSVFTPEELEYLQSQRLGRIARAGLDNQPHVVPVGFRYDPDTDTIDIGGHHFAKRKKWRDVHANPKVAFVVDDIRSLQPWVVRGIEVRGDAETLLAGGKSVVPRFDDEMFRNKPQRVYSCGLMEGDWGSGRDV